MANHASAIKRHRQSLKRRDRNRGKKAAVRNAIKDAREAAQAGDKAKATKLLHAAERMIASAGGRNVFHRRNASRKISRLTVFVNKSLATKSA